MGMLTLFLGDAGLGKSFLSLYIAAIVSTGGDWPDGDDLSKSQCPIGSVVILSAEDDLEHIIRPRLDTLKADCSKIISLEAVSVCNVDGNKFQKYFSLKDDLLALEQAIKSCTDCRLVIIDPLSAYLGDKTDSYRDSDVRSILAPLVQLAEQHQVAVIGVMHLNKNNDKKAIHRGLGSVAFTATARTVWLVSEDPENPASKRRLFTPLKHNVLVDPTGLALEIIDGKVVFEKEPLDMTADEALQGSTVDAPLLEKAKNWLIGQLPKGKSVATLALTEAAKQAGITPSTLRRAKEELNVHSFPIKIQDKNVWFVQIQ
jgi:hypothetical protein